MLGWECRTGPAPPEEATVEKYRSRKTEELHLAGVQRCVLRLEPEGED